MNQKNTLFLIVVSLIGLYLVLANTVPRYEYIDDQTPDLLRFDRVEGKLQCSKEHYGGKWYNVVSKSIAKVERPTISYEEFMKGREISEELLNNN